MPTMNEAWHKNNIMPKNATREQRIQWHGAHAKACGCREVPLTLVDEMRKRKLL